MKIKRCHAVRSCELSKQIWSSQNFYGSMNTHENMNGMVSTLHMNNTNLTFTGVKTKERGLS